MHNSYLLKGVSVFVRTLAFLLTAAVILFGGSILAAKALSYIPLVVASGSMEPAIPTGSLVFANQKKEPHVGDCIAFRTEEAELAVTHRVVRVELLPDETGTGLTRRYSTKGDANESEDLQAVEEKEVLGVVGLTVPRLGFALAGIGRPQITILVGWILGINLLSAVLSELSGDRKDGTTKQKRNKNNRNTCRAQENQETEIEIYDEENDYGGSSFRTGGVFDDWNDISISYC